ncbi:putative Na(+)/H(+) exchanger [Aquicella siphonis]|uniref:Putative Na(+)/H(+) exchanger n=1 Tax=Aquicella siphonis TaxID=254247 RepID=A0A5E4PDF8_9COXI|nr:Na+/H+ antiporter [Aquicella siphonis]VVC74940.1 putative Na(+)/H(+) exchanger [Aquicella siphonis]
MNFIEASIFILFVAIISVPLSIRLRLPMEVFLFIGSCMISLLPGLPDITFNPIIVFELFLPPILFSAAYFTDWREFKFNLRPITQLAFGLVLFTTVSIACVARFFLPGFTWAEAFLLGSIVAPTDAAAATSIIKKIGVPRRFIVILEGESLINDATALILYRFSLGAVLYGAFSLPEAIETFFIMSIGGAAIGLIIALSAIIIVKQLKEIRAETTFTFITAFTSYLLAEHLGCSGVISTVVCGIYFGIRFPEIASSHTRVNAKASWSTLMFIINGFVFTLIGFELSHVLKSLKAYSFAELFSYGLMVSLTVIVLRLLWIYPSAAIPRLIFPSLARKDPQPAWQFLFALGWTGMRGIVSLAAVLAIPRRLPSGQAFPNMDMLVFLTYCVIVTTLIAPAITLSPLIRWLRLNDGDNKLHEEAVARVRALEEVIRRIEEIKVRENIPDNVFQEFRAQIERKLKIVQTQLEDNPYSLLSNDYFAYKKLALAALAAERETLIWLRRKGEIHDEVFHRLLDELDLEDVRAKSLRV